jgi:hypothetical protein
VKDCCPIHGEADALSLAKLAQAIAPNNNELAKGCAFFFFGEKMLSQFV